MKYKKYNRSLIMRRFRGKAGSALIWALAVALILVVILAAGLGTVQRQQNANVQQHIENQAYFSAMSVTRAVLYWLDGASNEYKVTTDDNENIIDQQLVGGDDRNVFIEWILSQDLNPNDPDGFFPLNISGLDFQDVLGDIALFATYNSSGTEISIKAVATYNDESSSVIGKLSSDSEAVIQQGRNPLQKIDLPDIPEYPATNSTGYNNLNTGQPTRTPVADYIITSRGKSNNPDSVNGNMKVLVVEGDSYIELDGNVDLLVIRANAVVTIGKKLTVKQIIIEEGGQTSFNPPSKLNQQAGDPICKCYILPGGSFINNANGFNQAKVDIYAYASNYQNKIAKIQLGQMEVSNIVIQPVGEYGGYTADVGNPGTLTVTGVIHLPVGYTVGGVSYGMHNYTALPNWGTLQTRVCNRLNTGIRPDEAPFCPHFLALNDPTVITTTETWGFAGFREG